MTKNILKECSLSEVAAMLVCKIAFENKKQILYFDLKDKLEVTFTHSLRKYEFGTNRILKHFNNMVNVFSGNQYLDPLGCNQRQFTIIDSDTYKTSLLSDEILQVYLEERLDNSVSLESLTTNCQVFVDQFFKPINEETIELSSLLSQIKTKLSSVEPTWHDVGYTLVTLGSLYDAFPNLKSVKKNIVSADQIIDDIRQIIPVTNTHSNYYPTFSGNTHEVVQFSKIIKALDFDLDTSFRKSRFFNIRPE